MRLFTAVVVLLACMASQLTADKVLKPKAPVYQRVAVAPHRIVPAPTSVTAFVGRAARGTAGRPVVVKSVDEFTRNFGAVSDCGSLGRAVADYFANGGRDAVVLSINPLSSSGDLVGSNNMNAHRGLYALDGCDFNLLCIPPYRSDGGIDTAVVTEAAGYCEKRRAIFIMDPPSTWTDASRAQSGISSIGTNSANAAVYFPRLRETSPDGTTSDVAPSGAVAGIIARMDAQRGVWKAPAGMEARIQGASALTVSVDDSQINSLGQEGINCLRTMSGAGCVVWGARTIQGSNRSASEWKYLPVRRLALHIERSVLNGTLWTSNETNAEPLWAELRTAVEDFLRTLWQQGAFQGQNPRDAYFVKCDRETTTQADINQDKVNLLIGFAPLRPAEFIVLHITQPARKP